MHYSDLRNYGMRLVHQHQWIEDAIQDVFLSLWRSDTQLSEINHPRSYLLSAFRRRLLKHIQSERDRHSQRESLAPHFDAFILSKEELLTAHEHKAEQQANVQKAIQTLSERRREALYLRFNHGLTHPEIADVMAITHQTARNYVSEALSHIRKHIKTVDAS